MMSVRVLVLVLIAVGLNACAVSDTARSGLRVGDEKNGVLVFGDGVFGGPAVERMVYADPSEREEYAMFKSAGKVAEVVYLTTRHLHMNNLSLDNSLTMDDQIKSWNNTNDQAQLEADAFRYEAGWIGMWVKPFSLKNSKQNCAAFNAEWDTPADDPNQQPSKMMFGYICKASGVAYVRADMETDFAAIGIRGISTRLAENPTEVSAVATTPTQVELAARVQQGPYGTSAFPHLLARAYRVGEDCRVTPCP